MTKISKSAAAPRIVRWTGHSHICRVAEKTGHSIEEHRDAMLDTGLNYFGFGHPWEPWDLEVAREWEGDPAKVKAYREDEIWKRTNPERWLHAKRFDKWRKKFSTGDFIFEIDQETPKVRFGHIWWLGWQPEFAPWHDYDAIFDPWQMNRQGPRPPYLCRMIPEVIRAQVKRGAMPVYAHPTSWWMQNGNHVTNIASTLVPDILTNQAAGCLVVMGYDADHKYYQELWFNLLSKGYFMTGVAETDACLDGAQRFDRSVFQNITPVDKFTTQGIQQALKRGRNVMTTGMNLRVQCGTAGPGDLVDARGGRISIRANRLERDHEYKLTVIHNGRVTRDQTIGGLLEWEDSFDHDGPGWVVVKLVNKSAKDSAAITNPIFFKREPLRVTGHPLPRRLNRYWEKPGAMDLLYYLAQGGWRNDFSGRKPGEVPWEAFRWDDWKKLLGRNAATPLARASRP